MTRKQNRRARSAELLAHIAGAVRARRRALKMTQEELAKRAGCSRPTIAIIESPNSGSGGSIEVLLDIAVALECEVGELLPAPDEWNVIRLREVR